jgi:hypothetical protein
MDTRHAKRTARAWVEANLSQWPGLRAAHLVGGITTTPDEAPWPAHKDVDLHLIFDEASPALVPTGPFPRPIEVAYAGLLIEAGLKSVADYRSAEAVLANPEIAHHLTRDSLLYDPDALLSDLQPCVRAAYPCRRWVQARLDYERGGLAGALTLLPMARATWGGSGEAMVLGYTSTFIAAALSVVTLAAPTTGSRGTLRVRDVLQEYGRPDLYEAFLATQGLVGTNPKRIAAFLREGEAAFDLAVTVRRSPHPFQHKLHAHLRPYFVTSCQSLLDEGYHREALLWLTPYYHASTDVILADGPEAERASYAARHAAFLEELGMGSEAARTAKFEQANQVYDQIFALAADIVAHRPDIVN